MIKAISIFLAALVIGVAMPSMSSAQTPPTRSLKIVVATDAPAEVKNAADAIAAAATRNPLLKIFANGQKVEIIDSAQLLAAKPEARAFAHLVLVGLMTDPMIQKAWQQEAKPIDNGIYVFGFGYFTGDLGYIESDRNPFLHGRAIAATPFETEVVTVTGTTPAGVAAAAQALIKHGLVNGVVAAGQWSRSEPGLLDRDPLAKDFTVPLLLPEEVGGLFRVGVSQASEDEYRGVLQDTGVEPTEIWRAKYYVPGVWDAKGQAEAMMAYHTGLHRRAYGNTLWAAKFESADQAKQAAKKIANAAHLQGKKGDVFAGKQPPFGWGTDSPGDLTLWVKGEWVMMCTLPGEATKAAMK